MQFPSWFAARHLSIGRLSPCSYALVWDASQGVLLSVATMSLSALAAVRRGSGTEESCVADMDNSVPWCNG